MLLMTLDCARIYGGRMLKVCRSRLVAAFAGAVLAPMLLAMVVAPAARAQDADSGGTITPQQIMQRRYKQARPRTAIPYKPADFDKFVGYYRVPGSYTVVHIYRQNDHFLLQPSSSPAPVEIYPDSPTEFFMKVVPAQVSFNLAPGGKVTGLVLHQNGLLQPLGRISARKAREVAVKLQARIKQDKPSPGTEATARRLIETQEAGHPDYPEMMPSLAALARLQQPVIQRMLQGLGPLQALKFSRVAPSGLDIYDATFTHGNMQVVIGPLTSDGKVSAFAIIRSPL